MWLCCPLASVDPSSPIQTTQHSGTSSALLFSQPQLTGLREEMGPGGYLGAGVV